MKKVLDDEVKLTLQYKVFPTIKWKTTKDPIGLIVGYNMGRNKRNNCNHCNSFSGQGFLVKYHSRKILAAQVTSKKCSVCSSAKAKEEEPHKHECLRNYRGSSKAMEADGALSLVHELDKNTDSIFLLKLSWQMMTCLWDQFLNTQHQIGKVSLHPTFGSHYGLRILCIV